MGGSSKNNVPSHESSSPNYREFFKIPKISSLIPGLPFLSEPTASKSIPEILGIYNDPANHRIPGLTSALQLARNRVEVALNITNGLGNGIHEVIDEAVRSKDPVGAVRAIIGTVVETYTTVAVNCPIIVVSGRVIQEGVRIAEEIAQSAGNVYFGTSTTAPSDYTTGEYQQS